MFALFDSTRSAVVGTFVVSDPPFHERTVT